MTKPLLSRGGTTLPQATVRVSPRLVLVSLLAVFRPPLDHFFLQKNHRGTTGLMITAGSIPSKQQQQQQQPKEADMWRLTAFLTRGYPRPQPSKKKKKKQQRPSNKRTVIQGKPPVFPKPKK